MKGNGSLIQEVLQERTGEKMLQGYKFYQLFCEYHDVPFTRNMWVTYAKVLIC